MFEPRSTFSTWIRAARNRHYVVTWAGLLSVMALSLQPLASALFLVRETYAVQPSEFPALISTILRVNSAVGSDMQVANLAKLGLNQDLKFQDLTSSFCFLPRQLTKALINFLQRP